MLKKLFLATLVTIALFSVGCSSKSGALPNPVSPVSYVTPTISNLNSTSTSVSKATGGIVTISCNWSSPGIVSTATGYLGFVKTISDLATEPVGKIGSATATVTANLSFPSILLQTTTDTTTVATDTTAFYEKFKYPISIPTKVGTNQLEGLWSADIPFVQEDVKDAPLGVHQMIFYMSINGLKTNTLSFEMTFVP
jgi:hypothetical protein